MSPSGYSYHVAPVAEKPAGSTVVIILPFIVSTVNTWEPTIKLLPSDRLKLTPVPTIWVEPCTRSNVPIEFGELTPTRIFQDVTFFTLE